MKKLWLVFIVGIFMFGNVSAVSFNWIVNGTADEVFEVNETVIATNPDSYVYLHKTQTSEIGFHLSGTDVCTSEYTDYKNVWIDGSRISTFPGSGKAYKGCIEGGLSGGYSVMAIYGAHSDGFDYASFPDSCGTKLLNTRHARPVMRVKCWGGEGRESRFGQMTNDSDIDAETILGNFSIDFPITHSDGVIDEDSYLFIVSDDSDVVLTYFRDTGVNTTRNPNAEVMACLDLDKDGVCAPPRTDKVCVSEDQIIMKLSSEMNSHASIVADNNYGWRICYNDIFGEMGNGVRFYNTWNDIVWLSANSNSHASAVKSDTYKIPISYGYLNCTYLEDSVEADCSSLGEPGDDFRCVVRVENSSNAHLADCDYLGSTYPNKICCKIERDLPRAYWTDSNGLAIGGADLGDTVQLRIEDSRMEDGFVNMKIYEADSGIFSSDDFVKEVSGEIVNGTIVGEWVIIMDDLLAADSKLEDLENFIFEVDGFERSNDLNISPVPDDDSMDVDIISPNCGEDFTLGDISEIIVFASDPDDNITGNVSVNGVNIINFSNGGKFLNYKWDIPGNVQVELFAINGRGYRRRTITSVMVVEPNVPRDYVAACIDNPADFSDITSSKVFFNASSSRGLVCEVGDLTPDACTSVPKESLYFSWRFSDGLINFNHDGNNILSYNFYKNFATAGHNWAVLDVEFI